jgi:hypothetical protein
VGINEKGVVKVWGGENWSQVTIIGNKINEEEMVRSIIDVVDKVSNHFSGPQA